MSTATQRAAAAKRLAKVIASDPFLKGDDVHLDLGGFPSLQPLTNETFEDDKFAPLSGSGSDDARELRKFLEEETSRATGINEVQVGRGIVGHLKQVADEWVCEYTFNDARHITRGRSRDDAAMNAARYVQNFKPDIRDLTSQEEQLVTWIAQSGKPAEAAEKFIGYAIPRTAELGAKVLTDPKYADAVDEAVFFAWSRARNDYSLSDRGFPKFLNRYSRDKRLTLALCDAAWVAYKSELQKAERTALFGPVPAPEPTAKDIDELSDDQISAQYKSIAKHLAQSARR